ncbi:protein insensitive-like [Anastrepha obliqua]|uniref:protein insensitive-like n=1 Tax=Anastrepha obliqua TaxID=95512 RepID=UPI002409C004|nr:protein insensitive-like [Anastrepha obliqua]
MDNKQLPTSSDNRHSQQQLAVNAAEATKPRNVNCTTIMNNQPSAPHATTEEESPPFEEEPHEKVLDEDIINDIIFAVTTRSGVSEEEVRNTIAAVCAEQRKLWEEENKGNMKNKTIKS